MNEILRDILNPRAAASFSLKVLGWAILMPMIPTIVTVAAALYVLYGLFAAPVQFVKKLFKK